MVQSPFGKRPSEHTAEMEVAKRAWHTNCHTVTDQPDGLDGSGSMRSWTSMPPGIIRKCSGSVVPYFTAWQGREDFRNKFSHHSTHLNVLTRSRHKNPIRINSAFHTNLFQEYSEQKRTFTHSYKKESSTPIKLRSWNSSSNMLFVRPLGRGRASKWWAWEDFWAKVNHVRYVIRWHRTFAKTSSQVHSLLARPRPGLTNNMSDDEF